jgi:hypothetical protein
MPGFEGAVLLLVGTSCEELSSFGSTSFGCRTVGRDVDWSESTLLAGTGAFERRLCKFESVHNTPAVASREFPS